ncbi:hypothetical protein KO02_12350 [Sphingobacterium sp. ML3W]|uniref:hypothetical protein n=1 Tax=Sphingobacterium sp. ML3W TaxID=1538644 RepID=UPI0004F93366|nr:hypothetical protein [Sphingobacterium sp. ML3W]AIM37394.1 hypothetical protein KO02_12350 [Sphingobacterium sp. ML3W]
MKRIDFLKGSALLSGVLLLGKNKVSKAHEFKSDFKFDELFEVHKGNDCLIYPKKDSPIYSKLKDIVASRLDLTKSHVYVPEHKLCLEIKESYTYSDFKHFEFFLTCIYLKDTIFSSEWGSGEVFFRFIKDSEDKMHFEYFQGGK